MSQSAYGRYIEYADKENGIVIYDDPLVSPVDSNGLKQIGIPATNIAVKELNNKQVANLVILGVAVGIINLITGSRCCKAIISPFNICALSSAFLKSNLVLLLTTTLL